MIKTPSFVRPMMTPTLAVRDELLPPDDFDPLFFEPPLSATINLLFPTMLRAARNWKCILDARTSIIRSVIVSKLSSKRSDSCAKAETAATPAECCGPSPFDPRTDKAPAQNGRGERIRTSGPCLPKTVLYQAELLPDRNPLECDVSRGAGAKAAAR